MQYLSTIFIEIIPDFIVTIIKLRFQDYVVIFELRIFLVLLIYAKNYYHFK